MGIDKYDVVIAGASFAGLSCASVLAENGLSVLILERKKDVTKGLHTTGIIVDEAFSELDLINSIYKPISQVKLFSPKLRHVDIKSDNYLFYATDTPALMAHMLANARKLGVKIVLNTPFINGKEYDKEIIINDGLAATKYLVGADGAQSQVAKVFNLGINKQFLLGVEAEYTGVKIENPDAFYCFLNQHQARGYLGWVIPGPKVVQIGLATHSRERPDINKFYQHVLPMLKTNNPQVVERRGGLIPIGGIVEPFYRNNVILLGDAAGMVSPLSAGGIHTALYYARRLANLILEQSNNKSSHPAIRLAKELPQFSNKKLLRKLYNVTPNCCLEALIASPAAKPLAKTIFFLKKRLPKSTK